MYVINAQVICNFHKVRYFQFAVHGEVSPEESVGYVYTSAVLRVDASPESMARRGPSGSPGGGCYVE